MVITAQNYKCMQYPCAVNFKIEKMANFMLCVFHHSEKLEGKKWTDCEKESDLEK